MSSKVKSQNYIPPHHPPAKAGPSSKVKIIFVGTPEFGAIILDKLIQNNLKPLLVITAPDKQVGRKQILTPPPVKILAEKYKIPILQPDKIKDTTYEIQNTNPDLIVVAAYSQIIPNDILKIPKYGCLNIHPSLLPRWRGPSPIQFAILNGDDKTGVTIIKMTEEIDAGPILRQKEIKIEEKETYTTLHNKLGKLGGNLLIETIPKLINNEIEVINQDESKSTYSKFLKKEDGKIDWKKSAREIERQIRAFNPWPGSFTMWKKRRIKILKARVLEKINTLTYPVGKTLVAPQNELCVQTGKGFLIIEKLQLEGKKEMASEEFIRGHPDFIGTILG